MTKNILALVGALAIIVVIGGAAYKSFGPSSPAPAPAFQQTPPKSISQIPVTQHFSLPVTVGSITSAPLTLYTPSNAGLAISQFSLSREVPQDIVVRVNGNEVFRCFGGDAGTGGGTLATLVIPIEPPIIVRPGQQVQIGTVPLSNWSSRALTVTGYLLTNSDLGL